MSEFADTIRQQAADALQPLYPMEASTETDPIVELMEFLLEDGAGGVLPPVVIPVTTDQWLSWNQLNMDRPDELSETIDQLLEEERVELPIELEAMREWAAWLLVSTLDRMM